MKKKDPKKEILRQLVHLLCGVAGIANIHFNIVPLIFIFIIFILGIILFLNINFSHDVHPILKKLIKLIERENGLVGQGVVTLFFSYLVLHSISLLNPELTKVSLASLAVLSYGDSAGTIFGILSDKFILPYNRKKNMVGLSVGIFFATFGSLIFVNPLFAFITSSSAMFFESTDLKVNRIKIDDNLLIPFVAFICLYFLMRL